MYAKHAFVHWYVGEGMEEGEFSELARIWLSSRRTTRKSELTPSRMRERKKERNTNSCLEIIL